MRAAGVLGLAGLTFAVGACDEAVLRQADPESPESRLARLEEETAGIEAVIETFHAAFDAKDGSRLNSLFTEVAEVYLGDGRVVRGRRLGREMDEMWAGWTDLQTTWELGAASIRRPYAWAKVVATITYREGRRAPTSRNLITMTFELRDNAWYITHLHMSGDLAGVAS